MNRRAKPFAERGVALVVTLILLSVIAFMAIAFLVLSSRERGAVTTTTDQALAKQAAEAGRENAISQLLLPMMVSGNQFSFGALVSTNYISPVGFVPGIASRTNVNYDVTTARAPLNPNERLQNLANLLWSPRPPVFIVTNKTTGSNDFRYYLDLNRNRRFEPTGFLVATNSQNQPVLTTNQQFAFSSLVGDPQWVGGLEFPDRPHAADNKFLWRYAYMVVPISQTLDINRVHNQAFEPSKATVKFTGADYRRNQGVGTWEINLASFLYDLNSNVYAWGGRYEYLPTRSPPVVDGNAFIDACSLLTNRYGGFNYPQSLARVSSLFLNGSRAFLGDGVDGYTAGPIMTTASGFPLDPDAPNRPTLPWPGADCTNRFQSPQDLFDPTKTSVAFTNRLLTTASQPDTYDRYTYYRLLSQLGTDSAPETPGKLNLNYNNLDTNVLGLASATNFQAWNPSTFFTNAAIKLLSNAGYVTGVGHTNLLLASGKPTPAIQIQVWPTNFYTPSVHRLFQLAANIYDATTNNRPFGLPSVFRPLFRRTVLGTNTVIFLAGYREVTNTALAVASTAPPVIDPRDRGVNLNPIPAVGAQPNPSERLEPLIAGVPVVIGAKKHLPNFNEFSMQTCTYVSRLLEFRRAPNDTEGPIKSTNQMYVVGITNQFALESWNSYSNAYPRNLQMVVAANMTAILTANSNDLGATIFTSRTNYGTIINIPAGTWRGWTNFADAQFSFKLPWGDTNQFQFLTNSTYINSAPWFERQTHIFTDSAVGGFYVPHWFLNLNAQVRYVLVDTTAGQIVDYVNLNNWEHTIDLATNLIRDAVCDGNPSHLADPGAQWCMNRPGGNQLDIRVPTLGIINQIGVGLALNGPNLPDIRSFSQDPYSGRDAESAVDGFRYNLMGWSPIFPKDQGMTFYKSNVFYAPFAPYRPIYVHTTWQANDPLVHYMLGDLLDLTVDETNRVDFVSQNPALNNIGQFNKRYQPWGGGQLASSNPDTPDYEIAAKDPNVKRTDDWDFPTNKMANIGWLGRVHRGTPWQTIYLKSDNVIFRKGKTPQQIQAGLQAWLKWTGNDRVATNWGQLATSAMPLYSLTNFGIADGVFSLPTNDWRILDLFTTAFNDNATRGQMSVNQTNLAAWSAVLSGVNVLMDSQNNDYIQPAGFYFVTSPPPLVKIVSGIINAHTNFPHGSFQRLGDILATPELTVASPYLTGNTNLMTDAVVERIPEQILGLLRGGEEPRFLIYSYGQALKPAPRSVYTGGGGFLGLCTNYQITAEVATRSVVRIDGAPNNPHAVIESFNVLPPD